MSPSSPLFFYLLFVTTSVHFLPSSAQNSLTEEEVSTSPTENGDLITAPERTTSSVSTTTKEPLLIDAPEEEATLNLITNEEALSINDRLALTEKGSPIVVSVGKEGLISNNSSFSNETQTFTNKISTLASSPLSMTVSPSSTSQLEEGPFQATSPLTMPHHQENKILVSAVPTKEATKATFTPPVIAKKCCENSDFWDGTNCVAKTYQSPFDPLTGATKDSESGHYNFTWETTMPNCPKVFKYQYIKFPGKHTSLRANKTHSYLEWTEFSLTRQTTEYCIGQQQDGNYSAVTCMADEDKVCNGVTCIRKCCPQGEVKSLTDCKPGNWNLSLSFSTDSGDKSEALRDLHLVPLVPNCPYEAAEVNHRQYHLLPTGKLYLRWRGWIIENVDFCVENDEKEKEIIAMVCLVRHFDGQIWKFVLPFSGVIISMFCLVFLILFHISTKKLRNVDGYCFLSYSFSLLLAYAEFFTNFDLLKERHKYLCVLNALLRQFALHAAFFWLSVICFDIWRVIRSSFKCIPLTGILEKGKKKFLLYASYAIGCPLGIVLVTLIMQILPPESSNGLIVPGIGEEYCWFKGHWLWCQ